MPPSVSPGLPSATVDGTARARPRRNPLASDHLIVRRRCVRDLFPAAHAEFAQDVVNMVFGGAQSDAELSRNFPIGSSACHECRDLRLATRQLRSLTGFRSTALAHEGENPRDVVMRSGATNA